MPKSHKPIIKRSKILPKPNLNRKQALLDFIEGEITRKSINIRALESKNVKYKKSILLSRIRRKQIKERALLIEIEKKKLERWEKNI